MLRLHIVSVQRDNHTIPCHHQLFLDQSIALSYLPGALGRSNRTRMVFLSTLQILLFRGGRHSRPRSVFVFGVRQLTQRALLEETVMGIFLIFPLSVLVAQLTVRLAAAGWRPPLIRSDVWTTLLITAVGDVFLEVLLPSLQCLPLHNSMEATFYDQDIDSNHHHVGYWLWLKQTWGFSCPLNVDRFDSHLSLTPDAVGTLLTIRLIFMCLGVYLGETFLPICLTGGIACGKTTVAQLLLDPKCVAIHPLQAQPPQLDTTTHDGTFAATTGSKPTTNTSSNRQRRNKKTRSATNHLVEPRSSKGFFGTLPSDEEGSFYILDTDSIGHEILLPPAILAGGGGEDVTQTFTVNANDSVYPDILDAFGDPELDNHNILDENGLIDRRKLGGIIFEDPSQRNILNRITHPRILLVMLRRILSGIFLSHHDVVCVDVPLLFEKGQLRWLFGLTIVVACSPSIQLQRLKSRNPDLTEQQCRDRIASQIAIEKKVAMADICIMNNGDMDALAEEVERVRREVMARMYGIGMSLLQMLLLVGGSLSLAVSSKLFTSWN
jgi:dephospho-CoA kinase